MDAVGLHYTSKDEFSDDDDEQKCFETNLKKNVEITISKPEVPVKIIEDREQDIKRVLRFSWVRVVLKYRHCDGNLCIKVTDDVACLLYRTDQAQDVKKIEKFHSQLMRLMVAKESRSAAMETD
ncbi:signal recognition particle 9 kDa protein [Athene cunicularia]|uniref:signal recognition particle 9 kDa protein n=1 Tax=Athene cunicularia TaxID=194338 RepID=UPI000EF67C00|nr:signal recognition particle 9 kDa protein [Athene cunicularia]